MALLVRALRKPFAATGDLHGHGARENLQLDSIPSNAQFFANWKLLQLDFTTAWPDYEVHI